MNLQDLPTKRKEKVFYKIQKYSMNCWKELPKIYASFELARNKAYDIARSRIVKRTDKGWEILEEFGI
jgi:hypothetical protein